MKKEGFTLLEVIIVVLILGILACLTLPTFTVSITKAKLATIYGGIDQIRRGMQLYVLESGRQTFPVTSGYRSMPEFATLFRLDVPEDTAFIDYYRVYANSSWVIVFIYTRDTDTELCTWQYNSPAIAYGWDDDGFTEVWSLVPGNKWAATFRSMLESLNLPDRVLIQ